MTEKQVGLVHCRRYDPEEVDRAVERAIGLVGGIGAFVRSGQRVLLKPNLLMGAEPAKAVTTHPAVLGAVARLIVRHGCTVVIADSPGAGTRYTEKNLRRSYEKSGFAALAAIPGVTLSTDTASSTVSYPEGAVMKRFAIIDEALAADAIVTVSKAKTHLFTGYSGAVKNLFGVVPGLEKPVFHARFRRPDQFSEMLLDLNAAVVPVLHIMDAVVGMEGDGPMSGSPRPIGAILAGADPTAVDVATSRLMGMDPKSVPTIAAAMERGVIAPECSNLEMLGDDPGAVRVPDFRRPSTHPGGPAVPWPNRQILRFLQRRGTDLRPLPVPDPERCSGCGRCVLTCPAGAMRIEEGRAVIDAASCIRCYCCHEMCTDGAIDLVQGIGGRIAARLLR
ncbi:Thylakoid associated protein [Methanofollis fontis]|uniref:Thylakoid associated protein n=2 Tax=Methanofollis fontis TaxID=2052832 RepID=A0A483CWC7_9EURY|nr:Thylakoid associated protein [Methanofollis fontis]